MDPRSLFILCTLGVSTAQLCHDGWLFSETVNKCYSPPNPAANFSQAVDTCANLQGILAVIHSHAEDTFLCDMMKKSSLKGNSSIEYWIGLSNRQSPGRWKWADNVDSEYTNWDYGYPTNRTDANCGAMELHSGKWRNLNCDGRLQQFVCETRTLTFNTRRLGVSRGARIARAAGDDCEDNDEECPKYTSWCNDTSEPGLVDFMRESCKKSCGFCEACVDLNSDCLQLQGQCNTTMLLETMKANCKRTCGYCSSTALSTSASATTATTMACADLSSDCAQMKSQCNTSMVVELMKANCKRTCGYCLGTGLSTSTLATTATTTACVDLSPDCAQMQNQCNVSMVNELMKANCKRTCGYCSACVDLTAHCEKNQCSISLSAELMKVNCKRTCGYCSGTALSTSTSATTATITACVDLGADCAQMQSQCNVSMLVEVMKANCKRTCGYCPACVDRTAHCEKNQCNISLFRELMKVNCEATCGYCSGAALSTSTSATTATTTACVDVSADCARMQNQCNVSMVAELMKASCKRTCGYCSGAW